MKKLILAIFLLSTLAHAQTPPTADIEIVESTPVGTILDNPDIRNTPRSVAGDDRTSPQNARYRRVLHFQ